jgi:hypothetical protein
MAADEIVVHELIWDCDCENQAWNSFKGSLSDEDMKWYKVTRFWNHTNINLLFLG